MARQEFSHEGSYDEAREALLIKADDHAIRLGLDPQVVRKALDWLAGFVRPSPPFPIRWALSAAISHYEAPRLEELFKDVDFKGLPQTAAFVDFLKNSETPLYSLEELAELTEAFISHLRHNRPLLLRTGLPRISFERCLFLHLRLTWLYYVKVPPSASFGRNDRGDYEASYQWDPRATGTGAVSDVSSNQLPIGDLDDSLQVAGEARPREEAKSAKLLSYEDAPLIKGLAAEDAARLEAGRSKIFRLKISVLQELVSSLRSGTADDLWDNCLRLLTEALTADEVEFYLRMDSFYSGLSRIVRGTVGGGGKLVIGGLTDLLDVIGHYEKEIVVGTMAQTREALRDLVKLDRRRCPRLIVRHYFQLMGLPERQHVDAAFELFRSLENQEKVFWKKYRRRVKYSLENEFDVEIVQRQRVKRKLLHKFKPEAGSVTKPLKGRAGTAQRLSQHGVPQIGELLKGKEYVFQKAGQIWMVKYRGEPFYLEDCKGTRVIHCLLQDPGREFHVLQLTAVVEKPQYDPSMAVYRSMSDQQLEELGLSVTLREDTLEILDEKAVQDCERSLERLKEERERSLESDDTERAVKLQEEIDAIEQHLGAALGIRRRPRKTVTFAERARVNIKRQITAVLKQIEEFDAALWQHLYNATKTGTYCSYNPEERIPWNL